MKLDEAIDELNQVKQVNEEMSSDDVAKQEKLINDKLKDLGFSNPKFKVPKSKQYRGVQTGNVFSKKRLKFTDEFSVAVKKITVDCLYWFNDTSVELVITYNIFLHHTIDVRGEEISYFHNGKRWDVDATSR